METYLTWYFGISLVLSLIGLGMTLTGPDIRMGPGTYFFATLLGGLNLYLVITQLS